VNVKLNSPFDPKLPESKRPDGDPGTPLVTVCVVVSLLVHLIVEPTDIVLLPGENVILWIIISLAPCVLPVVFVVLSSLLHPKTIDKIVTKRIN
jgi:hypothetical protein